MQTETNFISRTSSLLMGGVIWGFTLIVLAVIFQYALGWIGISSDSLLVFFPGLIAFMGDSSASAYLFAAAFTIIPYFLLGLLFHYIYQILGETYSRKIGLALTLLIPIIFLIFFGFNEKKKIDSFFHVGATPQDCASLEFPNQEWCYRNIYREYAEKEVCLGLIDESRVNYMGELIVTGEAIECVNRFGFESGDQSVCSVFPESQGLRVICQNAVGIKRQYPSLCEDYNAGRLRPTDQMYSMADYLCYPPK